ncbi:MAG: MOSC domain-containing protein [Acetobacteraceae bacterium]|nr:MOSC domain-containing protein [Acetobacteraceae bacterium]
MRVERICRYPVKGLSPEAMEEVRLEVGQCLPEDRLMALAQADAAFDVEKPSWARKTNFACLAANARLALLHTAYDPASRTLVIRPPEGAPVVADLSAPAGRAAVEDFVTGWLGEQARGRLRLVQAEGHRFTDIPDKAVSIIGLASLAALEQATGQALDPLRFRANIYVSGGLPWQEFDWLGQEIMLGRAKLRVFKRTQRCAATEVNPRTGERDATPPRSLRQHFGHLDLGIYATVIEAGTVAVGDALEPILP